MKMKTKLLTIAMTAALMLTAMMKIQAQSFDAPCLPSMHGLDGHQSAFCGSSQTIELSAGWNWISTYIELDPIELLEMLEAELGDNGIQIKSSVKVTAWDEDEEEWSGGLQSVGLTNDKTYMVEVQLPANTTMTVSLVGPASTPEGCAIEINPGWNWIGFPSAVPIEVNEALSDFDAVAGDELKTRTQATAWDEDEEEWSGRLNILIPGQGYMYYSNSTDVKTLVFSTTAGGKFLWKQKE